MSDFKEFQRTKAVFYEMAQMNGVLSKLVRIGEHALSLESELTAASEERDALKARLQRVEALGWNLVNELVEKTSLWPQCSCHPALPKCPDCEQNEKSRDAIKAWEGEVKA